MNDHGLLILLGALALLAYLMVTCILRTLAVRIGLAIDIHERVRESKLLRQEYLDNLELRRHNIEIDE
ncbi:MAG: hypothetical protein GC164_01160 [Phycisphaera sp.]|nr:hypothetical protein [Phycisphaera sp.]